MKVELITFTPDALELLILSKSTRLKAKDTTLEDIKAMSWQEKMEHLSYMKDTIKSSWEFVDYTFRITDVTRAFTHQFVRTRSNSYAQEAQRVVDVSDSTWLTPENLIGFQQTAFDHSISESLQCYDWLRKQGVAPQDARGIVPTNIHTNIMAKINLRSMSAMAEVRLCTRTQGEYQNVFRAMRDEVLKVHPWAAEFINVHCVAYGTCCFPRYTECPFHHLTYNHDQAQDTLRKQVIANAFWSERHESSPVAHKTGHETTDGGKSDNHS